MYELSHLASYLERQASIEKNAYTLKFTNNLVADYAELVGTKFDQSFDKVTWGHEDTMKIAKQIYVLLDDYFGPDVTMKRAGMRTLAAQMELSRPDASQMEGWKHFWKVNVVRSAINMLAYNIFAHYYVFDMYLHNFSALGRALTSLRRRIFTNPLRYVNVTFHKYESMDNRNKRIFMKFLKAPNVKMKAKIMEMNLGKASEKMLPEASGSLVSYLKRHRVYRLPKILL